MDFASPSEIYEFIRALVGRLRSAGFVPPADTLQKVQTSAFTTSSEWLGELGLAIRAIQSDSPVTAALNADLERVMAVVKGAYPDI